MQGACSSPSPAGRGPGSVGDAGPGAARVLPAAMLSCEGMDDVSSLIIHLFVVFKWPDLKVSSGPTTVELRLTSRWLPEAGFAALAGAGVAQERGLKRAQAAGPRRGGGAGSSVLKHSPLRGLLLREGKQGLAGHGQQQLVSVCWWLQEGESGRRRGRRSQVVLLRGQQHQQEGQK